MLQLSGVGVSDHATDATLAVSRPGGIDSEVLYSDRCMGEIVENNEYGAQLVESFKKGSFVKEAFMCEQLFELTFTSLYGESSSPNSTHDPLCGC